ncbi:Uncharacterized protein Rs2_09971 [Raphanus sativus]|uniref:Uncharacterized protein LOC108829328 n=1 Tax=Raphanus sativus TaxID=3726 RepID=A0A6J0LFT2_RAPSA|nr:uncharacterized protein LOC108829328 [Raphanus sativus]KAJ4906313.1 Uncharacterized protein Rs2_09971 [Raphanus sativus]
MPLDFEPADDSTVNVLTKQGSLAQPIPGSSSAGKGKSVADDGSSSDNDLPQERPAVTYTNRKNGPDLKKLDALYRPNILAMSSWSEAEYAEYDTYLVKKWECNGFDKSDNAYVSIRSLNSRVSISARRYYRFRLPARGKLLPSVANGMPDLSNMHNWTGEDYDSYDSFLINKWKLSGFGENAAEVVYVGIRDPSSMVFKASKRY